MKNPKNKNKKFEVLYYAVFYRKDLYDGQDYPISWGAVVEEKETGFLVVNGEGGIMGKTKRMFWQKDLCKTFSLKEEAEYVFSPKRRTRKVLEKACR